MARGFNQRVTDLDQTVAGREPERPMDDYEEFCIWEYDEKTGRYITGCEPDRIIEPGWDESFFCFCPFCGREINTEDLP